MTSKGVHTAIRYTKADRIFLLFSFIILSFVLVIVLYPLMYVLASSVSPDYVRSLLSTDYTRLTLHAYELATTYKYFASGFINSVIYTSIGCILSLLLIVLCAYPLSKRKFYCGRYILVLCFGTYYFSGGLIPFYMLVKSLGILNTMWSVILTSCFSVYNMFLLHVHFRHSLPEELEDAAKIDGCGEWRFLFQIMLPLSIPILTTLGLYYVVGSWNSYFNAMIYISDRSRWPLANVLREVLVTDNTSFRSVINTNDGSGIPIVRQAEMMKYALIVIASFPLLCIYPFLQKFFVHGLKAGAVKG